MSILNYIEKMKEMYEGERITAQESRNMYSEGQLVTPSVDGSRPGYQGKPTKYGVIIDALKFLIKEKQTNFKSMSALKDKIKELTGKRPGGSFQMSQVDYKPLLEKFNFKKFVTKKPKQVTGITEINAELLDKIKNANIKGVNVVLETSKKGQKSIRVKIQNPEVRKQFFGKNKTQAFPANEEGFTSVQNLVDDIFLSNIYKNKVKPFKTKEYFRKLRRLKDARYKKQDPHGIYKALQEYKTKKFPGTMSKDIVIQHGDAKFTTQTLSRMGLIPSKVNVSPAVEKAERLRNEILSKTLVKLKNKNLSTIKRQELIEEANSAFIGLKNQLKGTEGHGLVNFPLLKSDRLGNIVKLKDKGFNPKKGLAYGEELGELDFANITKEQANQIIDLGKKKIDVELLNLKNFNKGGSVDIDLNMRPGYRGGYLAGGARELGKKYKGSTLDLLMSNPKISSAILGEEGITEILNLFSKMGLFADGGRAGYMGGGIAGIRRPHAIPPKRQGLRSIMINVNDD